MGDHVFALLLTISTHNKTKVHCSNTSCKCDGMTAGIKSCNVHSHTILKHFDSDLNQAPTANDSDDCGTVHMFCVC